MKKAEAKAVSPAAPQAQQENLAEAAATAEPSPAPAAAAMPAATEPQGVATAEREPARKLFAAGDFDAAGESWRNEIVSQRVRFSILLEFDCLKESVRDAYGQLTDKEKFFLLNKNNRNGQNCWLVLWGRYDTADEAAQAMKFAPEYFLRQGNPPVVVELEPYL
jgi:septal ring-binding cell division protein DamX